MGNKQSSYQVDRDTLFALIDPAFSVGGRLGSGGQPNPDEPLKPGPWDPVIRLALKDMAQSGPFPEPWRTGPDPIPWRFGPSPDPWIGSAIAAGLIGVIGRRFPAIFDVISGGLNIGDLVALNPQPLPPRERFVRAAGEALAARAEQMAELAGSLSDEGEERGIIVVGGYVNRLVDEWCGTGFRPRWPFPGPPPWWFREEIGARDILVLGASLHDAGARAYAAGLRRALGEAAGKLAQAGLQRMH